LAKSRPGVQTTSCPSKQAAIPEVGLPPLPFEPFIDGSASPWSQPPGLPIPPLERFVDGAPPQASTPPLTDLIIAFRIDSSHQRRALAAQQASSLTEIAVW
jgi:hypothetical protein